MRKIVGLVVVMSVFINCGGSSDSSDNSDSIPNVSGVYTCIDGCLGTCTFDDELTVLQNESNIILRSDSFPDASGTINSNGQFDVSSDNCDCEGTIIDDTAVASCTCDGSGCQTVTYEE